MIEIDLQDHLQMLSNWYKCPFIISTVALFRCKLFSPIDIPRTAAKPHSTVPIPYSCTLSFPTVPECSLEYPSLSVVAWRP